MTGTLEGTILALSPVHVASGQTELTGKQPPLVKAHFRRNGRLTIPGSSLKGAVRNIVEAISYPPSCLRVTRARFAEQPNNVQACTDKERLCVACRCSERWVTWGRCASTTRYSRLASQRLYQPRRSSLHARGNGSML